MNIILFDNPTTKKDLLPFTFIRPIAHIRVGILTIAEKWEKLLPGQYSYLTDNYLQYKFPQHKSGKNLYISGNVLPNHDLLKQLKNLKENQFLYKNETLIAVFGDFDEPTELLIDKLESRLEGVEVQSVFIEIKHPWDIFEKNRLAVIEDFRFLTNGRKSAEITDRNTVVYNPKDVFIEEGAKVRSAILNAEKGPIYIGRQAEIGEGSIIRGATAVCDHAILNFGTRIRGDSTIGPFSKAGGEISNSVIFGYSSKSHDGFLGNSVVGEWCNMGAGANTSNLKNNYSEVNIWNYIEEGFLPTGRQFCGLMMGDHSKCGISTMFNTGTVVGISANIFGGGFPKTFIPSFSWGGAEEFETFQFDKALEVMQKVMRLKENILSKEDVEIVKHIFEVTKKYRKA